HVRSLRSPVLVEKPLRIELGKGWNACQALVQDAPEGVQIGTSVHALAHIADLFWRGIFERADGLHYSERCVDAGSEAEIDQSHSSCDGIKDDILRLYVAMNQPTLVNLNEGARELTTELHDLRFGHRSAHQPSRQCLSCRELHDHVWRSIG